MKSFIFSLAFALSGFIVNAQNCGRVIDFTYNIVNNNNGNSTYDFWVTIEATSGGSKSVLLTIKCGNYEFIEEKCEASQGTTRIIHYGPFTTNTRTGSIELIWSGHTNANCGGATCYPEQVFARTNLPVELSSFQAVQKDKATVLAWTTASEKNNDAFVVERSTDGLEFEPIGEVEGHGTTTEAKSYRFIDTNPAYGDNYYRLKQIDFNGEHEYSDIANIDFNNGEIIAVYPTVVQGNLNVEVQEDGAAEVTTVAIYNLQGAMVYATAAHNNPSFKIELPSLPNGQYLVLAQNGNQSKRTLVFVAN